MSVVDKTRHDTNQYVRVMKDIRASSDPIRRAPSHVAGGDCPVLLDVLARAGKCSGEAHKYNESFCHPQIARPGTVLTDKAAAVPSSFGRSSAGRCLDRASRVAVYALCGALPETSSTSVVSGVHTRFCVPLPDTHGSGSGVSSTSVDG